MGTDDRHHRGGGNYGIGGTPAPFEGVDPGVRRELVGCADHSVTGGPGRKRSQGERDAKGIARMNGVLPSGSLLRPEPRGYNFRRLSSEV